MKKDETTPTWSTSSFGTEEPEELRLDNPTDTDGARGAKTEAEAVPPETDPITAPNPRDTSDPEKNSPESQYLAVESPDARSHADIPDGGLEAWLQVVSGVATLVATWGLVNSFGVFQTYYETVLLQGRASSSTISWIGSLQSSLLMALGIVSGPLHDAGHFRILLITGLFLVVLGMFMTSLATEYWHLLLAQGVCVGTGMGLAFLPSTAVLAQYFSRRLPLVLGMVSAGSPVAGIVFPIIFSRLEPRIGFGWATRTIAFILLALCAVPVAFMHVRRPGPGRPGAGAGGGGGKRVLFDATALRDPAFVVFAVACFTAYLVLYVPFFYTQLFTMAHGIADDDFAPYLVTFLNVGSVFGRLVPNALARRLGGLNVIAGCAVGSTALAFAWFGTHDLAGLVVFALLYGAFSGGIVSLSASCLKDLTPDLSRLGARMGMSFCLSGVALLVGTPIAGAILGDGNWTPMIGYTAALMTVSVFLFCLSRYLVFRRERL